MFSSLSSRWLVVVLLVVVAVLLLLIDTSSAFVIAPERRTPKTTKLFASDGGGPAVLDKPETVEKVDEDTDRQNDIRGEEWQVRLWNDPYNKREFVARCLATVCSKSDTESFQIMMQAHQAGMGIVGLYAFEIAELYRNSLVENGLLVDIVPVEDHQE